MSSESGTCVKRNGVLEVYGNRKRRRLPTPPSTSSSDGSPTRVPQPPPLPYAPGACFDIKPHDPPPPYDGGIWYYDPDLKEWNGNPWPWGEGSPDTIVEQLLAHPPRKTFPLPDQTLRRLEVTHQIRCGDRCNAQVVRCLVEGRELVAKIFDPLYVGLDVEHGRPPTYYSERFYSCEAAAYKRIKDGGLDGKFTPQFEGCWYLELPLEDANGRLIVREVHLILQQFIPGETMEAMIRQRESEQIEPEVRMELIARLLEATSQLDFIGVRTSDNHPRNFMLVKDEQNQWQIVIIDFSHSRVKDLPNSKWWTLSDHDPERPESPITVLGGSWPVGCRSGWAPKEYEGRTKESYERRLKWMKDRWEGSDQYGAVNYRWLWKRLGDGSTNKDDLTDDDSSEDDSSEDDSCDGSNDKHPVEGRPNDKESTDEDSTDEGSADEDSTEENSSKDDSTTEGVFDSSYSTDDDPTGEDL